MNEDKTIEAYSDRVVLRRVDIEYKVGSLFVGELEKDSEVMYAQAVAVGEGKQIDTLGVIPMKTKIGDIVVVNARIPLRVNIRGLDYYVVNESNILFKYTDKQAVLKDFKKEGYEYDASGTKILN